MKRNIDDFDGMKDFIISIIGAVAWFLIGTIVIVGYFTIETKGESIVISLISMFFTIVSSLGIAATIGVYIWQKNENKTQKNNKIEGVNMIIAEECKNINYLIDSTQRLINSIDNQNKLIEEYTIDDDNFEYIDINSTLNDDKYTVVLSNVYLQQLEDGAHEQSSKINKITHGKLSEMLYTSASLDFELYYRVHDTISIIKEVNHVLNYFLNFNEMAEQGNVDGLISYGKETLDGNLSALKEIYLECTGKELKKYIWNIR
ncbi:MULTISPECIES: hypothetical protein [Providencia]|uniref:hypothetical protein n=1 Tax=Providencia TaxID=586 RepID=UPI00234B130B|nr:MULTISPECIES: hypothetical protein [unclassified Providencia]